MLVDLQPPFVHFTDWMLAADRHARRHLPLLARAQRVLAGLECADDADRHALADHLERWRYQLLSVIRESPSALGKRLSEVLDLAANELCGRVHRSPRCPRDAVGDTFRHPQPLLEALHALDSGRSLDAVERRAAEITQQHFAVEAAAVGLPAGSATAGRAPGADTAAIGAPIVRHVIDPKVMGLTAADAAAVSGGKANLCNAPAASRSLLLYAPLYLSSHCVNYCVYCGFRYPNDIERRHLSAEQAMAEADILWKHGIRHVLLVAGDFPRLTSIDYLTDIVRRLTAEGFSVAVETAPQTTAGYAALVAAGVVGVTLYQETYSEVLYALYHPHGTKADYDWRLEGLERAAEAGVERLGLGILLGLAEPQEDLQAMIRHALYLKARFPESKLAFSLPRIHQAPKGFEPPYPVADETLVCLYAALRAAMPDADLVLSTRETAALRNRLAASCITQLSAGSSTVPGGYESGEASPACAAQFPVIDQRTPREMAQWCAAHGLTVCWRP